MHLRWARRVVLLAVLASAGTPGLSAQTRTPRADPPSLAELRDISRRGQMLAQYDRVAWLATDAVQAQHPSGDRVRHYIAQRMEDSWVVAFGRLTPTKNSFLIAYEARLRRGDSVFRVTEHRPARSDAGYFLRAARAIDLAREAFTETGRPYNVAVIPADSGSWWVYVYPAQTQPNVWPLGADERFHVSADGLRVLGRRRMHRGVIEYNAPPGDTVEMYTHGALLDDVPEDTDVFIVITRRPRAPELVVTEAFVYRIDVNGAITFLGRREEVLGDSPPSG